MLDMLGNKVAIQPRFDPNMTEGGLFIPDIAKERCDQGIVKYIGPKVKDIKIGDYVMFGGYDGAVIQFGKGGEGTLIILHEPFIKCVVKHIATDVPGLFFEARLDKQEIAERNAEIEEILSTYASSDKPLVEARESILRVIAKYDRYFTATYEMATQIMMDAMTALPGKDTIQSKIHDREKIDHIEVEEDE